MNSPDCSMSVSPRQVNRQLSLPPCKVCSAGVQLELSAPAAGTNVATTSLASAGLKQRELICGGPITPPVIVRLVIRHRPGAMPSAKPAVAAKAMAPADATAINTKRQGPGIDPRDPARNSPTAATNVNSTVTIYPAHFAREVIPFPPQPRGQPWTQVPHLFSVPVALPPPRTALKHVTDGVD